MTDFVSAVAAGVLVGYLYTLLTRHPRPSTPIPAPAPAPTYTFNKTVTRVPSGDHAVEESEAFCSERLNRAAAALEAGDPAALISCLEYALARMTADRDRWRNLALKHPPENQP